MSEEHFPAWFTTAGMKEKMISMYDMSQEYKRIAETSKILDDGWFSFTISARFPELMRKAIANEVFARFPGCEYGYGRDDSGYCEPSHIVWSIGPCYTGFPGVCHYKIRVMK